MPLDSRHLYLETPDGEVLQMCFLRPSAQELVTKLPYLLEYPSTLQMPRPSAMAASAVLAGRAGSETMAAHTVGSSASLDANARAQVLLELEQALLRGGPLPASAGMLRGDDWHEALSAGNALDALGPLEVTRLSRQVRSPELARLLLRHRFPRLLKADAEAQIGASAIDQLCETAPLPEALSETLLELLHTSDLLRLPAAEYDEVVVAELHRLTGLGRRAAAQAALVYVANHQEKEHNY
eukprot:scaffold225244_cov31-Tisochrysis_lutea.AAC.4